MELVKGHVLYLLIYNPGIVNHSCAADGWQREQQPRPLFHCLWSVGSTRAGCQRGTMPHQQLCWNTRGMRSAEHRYVARRVYSGAAVRVAVLRIVSNADLDADQMLI